MISCKKDDRSQRPLSVQPNKLVRVLAGVIVVSLAFGLPVGFAAEPTRAKLEGGELGRYVNPMIGTGGMPYLCGNNFPGASVPFGVVRLSPDTISTSGKKATNSSGYFYADSKLLGFSHTRLAGTGATDGGNVLVVPTTSESIKASRRGMNAAFSHQDEVAFPGYYSLNLPKQGILCELTTTQRVGVHRYTFDKDKLPQFSIHATSVLGKGESRNGTLKVIPERGEFEGSVKTFGTFSKRYGGLNVYFVGRFDRSFERFVTWSGGTESPERSEAAGDDLGLDVVFAKSDNAQTIGLNVAISHVSIDNARANLAHEASNDNFDQVLAKAVARWEEIFSRIRVTGGSDRQRTIFRTAVFHSFQMPSLFNDVNGDYLGFDRQVHRTDGFKYYTDLSMWDTFRTVHPLFNLIARREQRDMVVSLIKMAEQGGYLPRWPSGGGYTNSMFGTPADMVITESYLKGIRDFDAEKAFQFMKKTALGPVPENSPFSGRVGVEHYLKYEYCPSDVMKKSVASTIEYSYADHSIARFADALGHRDDADLFTRHARYYRNLFNPETQFFHPRDSKGNFSKDFQPDLLTYLDFAGTLTHAYVEGSAWQWRWGVPSDAPEVVSLFKSREYFVQELEQFFAKSPVGVGINPNAFYWQGNQPDIYAAYLFNFAGRPDLTQKWVQWILETKYGDRENGIDGNDDGGTLSAWYVLSSIGLFPTAGTDRYELTTPIWEKAELKIGDKTLTVTNDHADSAHPYIKTVWLNDQKLDRRWIRHDEIGNGGTLRFETDSEPSVIP